MSHAPAAVTVTMAQFNPLVGDIAGNTRRILELARQAQTGLGAGVVVFPELALCGYPPEDLLLRPEFVSRCEAALAELATAAAHGPALVIGHPQRGLGGLYNAASFLAGGRVLGVYAKQLLPNYGVFDEKRYFVPGSGPCVVEHLGTRFGLTVCEDIWQPGPVAQAAQAGAELILNLNASPWHRAKAGERLTILHARVHEAGVPIVYVNQVGGQDELVFDGGSMLVDADGTLLARAPAYVEGLYPLGFDRELWGRLLETGAPGMGVAEEHGGGGASLGDLVVVAEELGRAIAPVPRHDGGKDCAMCHSHSWPSGSLPEWRLPSFPSLASWSLRWRSSPSPWCSTTASRPRLRPPWSGCASGCRSSGTTRRSTGSSTSTTAPSRRSWAQ